MSEEREVEHFNVVIVSEAFFREKWNKRRLEESKCEKRPIEKKANKREEEGGEDDDEKTKTEKGAIRKPNSFFFSRADEKFTSLL